MEVIQEGLRQLLEWFQPLPTKLVDPILQIAQHRAFIVVVPEPIQTLFQQVRLHHAPIQRE
jgi:hypothetical protein